MSKKCDCCGKSVGFSGGHSVKDGIICGRCYDIYTGVGRTFRKNLKVETIKEVVENEGASVETKPFIVECMEIPIQGIMQSPKKTFKWSIIAFVLAALITGVVLYEPFMYLKDGAKARFVLDDVDRKWINNGEYEVTEHYVAEKDGQTIRAIKTYTEYTDEFDNVIGTDGDEDSPFGTDDYVRVYRKDGKWKEAGDVNLYSMLLMAFVPIVLYIYAIHLIKHYFKIRRREVPQAEGEGSENQTGI